jgi:hypothetical protein
MGAYIYIAAVMVVVPLCFIVTALNRIADILANDEDDK